MRWILFQKTQEGRASSSHPLTTQNSLGDSAVIHSDHNGVAEVGPEAPLEDEKGELHCPVTFTQPVQASVLVCPLFRRLQWCICTVFNHDFPMLIQWILLGFTVIPNAFHACLCFSMLPQFFCFATLFYAFTTVYLGKPF